MSFDYNKWENELRSKVEKHEFAFDASAWDEMDKLLDQGLGTTAPKDNTTPASAGRFTSWIISGLLIIATGLLCWWMINTSDEKTITLSGFNIGVTPKETTSENQVTFENAPTIEKAGSDSNPKSRTVLPANLPPQVTGTTTTETTIVEITTFNTPNPIATPPAPEALADRSAAYLTPFLDVSKDIPPLPTVLDDPFPETLPITIKQRRNRRTLYPDVIERY